MGYSRATLDRNASARGFAGSLSLVATGRFIESPFAGVPLMLSSIDQDGWASKGGWLHITRQRHQVGQGRLPWRWEHGIDEAMREHLAKNNEARWSTRLIAVIDLLDFGGVLRTTTHCSTGSNRKSWRSATSGTGSTRCQQLKQERRLC